jgi:hypothetical protein
MADVGVILAVGLGGVAVAAGVVQGAACWLLACRVSVLWALLAGRRRRARYRMGHGRRGAPSAFVGARLERIVLWADRGRCVVCGDRARVQVDHVQPWAGGGLTWLPNVAVLCRAHNVIKGNYSVDPDGFVHMRVRSNIPAAREIIAAERAARRRPVRWVRLALGVVLAL